MARNIHSSTPGTLIGRTVVTWFCAAILLLLTGLGASNVRSVVAQTSTPLVYVVPIEGMIDLGLAPFLSRTIGEAKEAGAAAVLLEINTFGGRVDAAVAMRGTLLNSPVRTIAFVNQRAISAGALIALACETLVMTEGGTIGAAAPVVGGAGESKPADEKPVSYVRKEFRATAEVRKRPPEFVEAVVDGDRNPERCHEITEEVLRRVFMQPGTQRVLLEGIILKRKMALSGLTCPKQETVDRMADTTENCILRAVPAAVPGIAILPGGQSAELASARLNAANARCNQAARRGKYVAAMEGTEA
jgi:hypothetical protein